MGRDDRAKVLELGEVGILGLLPFPSPPPLQPVSLTRNTAVKGGSGPVGLIDR